MLIHLGVFSKKLHKYYPVAAHLKQCSKFGEQW